MGCCQSKVHDVNAEAIRKPNEHDLNNLNRKNDKVEIQRDLNKQEPITKVNTEALKRAKEYDLNDSNNNKNKVDLQDDDAISKRQPVTKKPTDQSKAVSQEEIIEMEELKQVEEWKALIESLLANQKIMSYALAKKNTDFKLVRDVGNYLAECKDARTITEKAWLVYVWVTHNIAYDVKSFKNKDYRLCCDPQIIIERGLAICSGYSALYKTLCSLVDVRCHVVNGIAKGVDYKFGVKIEKGDGHAWNGIPNLGKDGKIRFVECTWGAGCVDSVKFIKLYQPYYFGVPAHVLFATHYSDEFDPNDGTRKVNLEEFDNYSKNSLEFYKLGLKCVDNLAKAVTRATKNPLVIEYASHERLNIQAGLKEEDSGNDIKCAITCQKELSINKDQKSKYCIIIHIPNKNKRYTVLLYACNKDYPNSINKIVTEFAVVRVGDEENYNIPRYNITFDYGIKLKSHSSQFIRFKTNPLLMDYEIPDDVQVGFYVVNEDGKEIENAVVRRKTPGDSKTVVHIAVPNKNERFFLKIFARYSNSSSNSLNYVSELCLIRTDSDKNDNLTFATIYESFDMFGLNCVTESVQGITKTSKNPLVIEYTSFQRLNIQAYLKEESTNSEIKNSIVGQSEFSISNDEKSKYCFIINIPKKETKYKCLLFASEKDSKKSENSPITEFLVVRVGDEENVIPKYNISFDYGIKLKSHFSKLIKFATNPLTMEFEIPNDVKTGFYVVKEDGSTIENAILVQKNPHNSYTTVQIALPKHKENFFLNIFARYSNDESNSLKYVNQLFLIREQSNKSDGLKFCSLYSDCAYIYSPKELNLTKPKNRQYEFKYFIKDALDVVLIDSSNKWIHFDKPDPNLNNVWHMKTTLVTGKLTLYAKFNEGGDFVAIYSYIVN